MAHIHTMRQDQTDKDVNHYPPPANTDGFAEAFTYLHQTAGRDRCDRLCGDSAGTNPESIRPDSNRGSRGRIETSHHPGSED